MSDLPLKATLKSGTGYDAPWLTIDAADPSDLEFKLNALLNGNAVKSIVEVAELFKAANTLGPVVAPQEPAQQQAQPAGWNNSPTEQAPSWAAQPQQAAPQQQSGGSGNRPGAQLHPEGKGCELAGCNNILEFKKTQTGKAKWQCPEWRWNNGNPNGHGSEFIN